jgi:hypothetical protein
MSIELHFGRDSWGGLIASAEHPYEKVGEFFGTDFYRPASRLIDPLLTVIHKAQRGELSKPGGSTCERLQLGSSEGAEPGQDIQRNCHRATAGLPSISCLRRRESRRPASHKGSMIKIRVSSQ